MSESYLPVNENVDFAVRAYVDAIVRYAYELHPTVDLLVEYDEGNNIGETEKAPVCYLTSKHGVVVVWPNFKTNSASACIFNRGLSQAMQAEGFGEDEMNSAALLGRLLDYTKENADIFGLYLTTDLGLQSQKDLNQEI